MPRSFNRNLSYCSSHKLIPSSVLVFIFLFIGSIIEIDSAYAEVFRRKVDIEWEPIEGAKSYEVELENTRAQADEKPITRQSDVPSWSGPLQPGLYKMRVRAKDKRGVPGAWSEQQEFKVGLNTVTLKLPKQNANIETNQNESAEIKMAWNTVGGAEVYEIEIISEDGKTKIIEQTRNNLFKTKIPVSSKYTWSVKAIGQGFESDNKASDSFTLNGKKLTEPTLQRPESPFVRELKWNQPDYATHTAYSISRFETKSKTWISIDSNQESKNPVVEFKKEWPGGRYKLAVKAKGTLRPSSNRVEIEFNVRGGDRSPATEETATVRQSIDRLSGWYGIASYLVTIMDFRGKNYDSNTIASFNGIGGTGRLGAGYLSSISPWGFVGIVDLSGINIEGHGNYTFASSEMNAINRTQFGERGELRQQVGLFYKELPELIGDKAGALKETNLLSYAGPHYGCEYWYAMNAKLGLQMNLHFYPSLFQLKTPSSQPMNVSISGQFGMLASYRLKKSTTGLIGYAFRHDEANYRSSDSGINPGNSNSAIIEGHYLNLFLEWAL